MRIRQVLKEIGVSRKRVIDWAKEEMPHLFHEDVRYDLRTGNVQTKILWCDVNFKTLLLHYLSKHNFKVTVKFASELRGW